MHGPNAVGLALMVILGNIRESIPKEMDQPRVCTSLHANPMMTISMQGAHLLEAGADVLQRHRELVLVIRLLV